MLRACLLLSLAACTPIPSSGHPFSPAPRAPAPVAAVPTGPQGDGSAFGDERTDEPAEGGEGGSRRDEGDVSPPGGPPDDTLAAMARFARTPSAARGAAPGTGSPVAPLPATPAPVWDPSRPLPDASFGVRVLGVLLDLNPPRAVLGLPDGREQVVTPGAMLPAEGIVVLAIGRDAVQIARVTPQGFYARVETDTVASLAPAR